MSELPLTPYAGTSGHSGGATSEERARRDDSDGTTSERQRRVLSDLAERHDIYIPVGWVGQHKGLTWKELARITGWHHGQASGALSVLHKEGLIARLTERRDRCFVYVLPEHVGDRETQDQGRKVKTPEVPTLTAEEESQVNGAIFAYHQALKGSSMSHNIIPTWRVGHLLAIIERLTTP